jgi:hypothetical protein
MTNELFNKLINNTFLMLYLLQPVFKFIFGCRW